jgi:hypothetical protein
MIFVKKYQSGGSLDTIAMREDIKKDNKFFKDGNYTSAGRKRLAAIQQIEDNQKKGLSYIVNDDNQTFKIVDSSGAVITDSEGQGMFENEGNFNPLYGLLGRTNKSKKEISKTMSGASSYVIEPTNNLLPKGTEQYNSPITSELNNADQESNEIKGTVRDFQMIE